MFDRNAESDPAAREPISTSMVVTIDYAAQASMDDGSVAGCGNGRKRAIKLRLEPEIWHALEEICWRENSSLDAVCTAVYRARLTDLSLESAMRLFILDYFRCAATEQGHWQAGHGCSLFTHAMPSHLQH